MQPLNISTRGLHCVPRAPHVCDVLWEPSLAGSRGHYITPWDCLSYQGGHYCSGSTTTTSVLTGWTEKSSMIASFEDEPLLSLHFRVVPALKPLLVRAPVANVQSAGKQHNVFSQRLLKTHLWRKVNKQ